MILIVADRMGSKSPKRHRTGRRMFPAASWRAAARSLQLSPREVQIVQAVFDRHDEAAIAEKLELSQHTIHTYIKGLDQKLSVTNRVELVLRVVEELVLQ